MVYLIAEPFMQERSLYFEDGKRKIDFILAYKSADVKFPGSRRIFVENLQDEGLEVEYDHKVR